MAVEEPKPAASLSASSVKRRMMTLDAETAAVPEPSREDGREQTDKMRGVLVFGAIYVCALLFFAAAFDVWSVVLG
jgi:hypothetical protein